MKKKIERLIKNNSFINKIFTFFGSLVIKTLGLFVKKEEKSILFVSYMGKNFNDSPKIIYDEILNDPFFNNYKLYWAFTDLDKFDLDDRVEIVKIDTLDYFKTAVKVSHWITNVNIERGLHFKPKSTIYVNTWHGIPLKKVGNDVKGRNDFDFSSVNFFPYSGTFEYDIYKRAFRLNDNNLYPTGMPRNEIVLDNNLSLKRKINGLYNYGDKKTILYAPTWREEAGDLKPLDIDRWKEVLCDDYVLLIRSHGLTNSLDMTENDFVIDVSDYEETAELIVAADVLLTDYSSIMFDFALTSKPIFIYAPDYSKYVEERGVYFDLNDYFELYNDESLLINAISSLDQEIEKEKVNHFKNAFFDLEISNSTEEIINYLKEI